MRVPLKTAHAKAGVTEIVSEFNLGIFCAAKIH